MQQKLILFLMSLLGILVGASSLDFIIKEDSSNKISNVATISDMVLEEANEAFLPNPDEAISYELTSIIEPKEDDFTVANIDIPTVIDEKPVQPYSKKEENVASLRQEDLVKIIPQRKSVVSKVNDKFANLKVSEGEEILVSTSKQQKTLSNQEKTVANFEKENFLPIVENKVVPEKPQSDVISKTEEDDSNPFGVIVSKTNKKKKPVDIAKLNNSPFVRAFSALKPETNKNTTTSSKTKSVSKKKKSTMASAKTLKEDLHRTYLSGNQYLSAYEDEAEDSVEEELEEDVDSEVSENFEENEEEYSDDEGFKEQKNVEDALEGVGDSTPPVIDVNVKDVKQKLQETKKSVSAPSGPLKVGTREVLQMKIDFQNGSSAVSGESVNLIRSFAQIATEQPTNSIEITIPEAVMNNPKKKKLTARRLSIVSNILRNAGVSDKQIVPVLSSRDEDSFAFRVISNDPYTKLRVSKGVDIFGEEENVKEYNIMKW